MRLSGTLDDFKSLDYFADLDYEIPPEKLGALGPQTKLVISAGEAPLSKNKIRDKLDLGCFFIALMIEDDDVRYRVAATSQIFWLDGNPDIWTIDFITVFDQYRGRGYSIKILNFIKDSVLPAGTTVHADVYSKLIYRNIRSVFASPIGYKTESGSKFTDFINDSYITDNLDEFPKERLSTSGSRRAQVVNARHVEVIWEL